MPPDSPAHPASDPLFDGEPAEIAALERAQDWRGLATFHARLGRHREAGVAWLRLLPTTSTRTSALTRGEAEAVTCAADAFAEAGLLTAAAGLLLNLGNREGAAALLRGSGYGPMADVIERTGALAGNPWAPGQVCSRPPPGAQDDESTSELRVPARGRPNTSPGELDAQQTRTMRALDALMSVGRADPHYPDAADQVARLAWEHGLMSVRVAVFLEPLVGGTLDDAEPEADTLYTVGRLYERIGLLEKAKAAYAQALGRAPEHRAAAVRAARLRAPEHDPLLAVADAFGQTLADPVSEHDHHELAARVHTTTSEFQLGPLAPGAVVADRFRVERALGEGGCGVVFVAHDTVRDEPVALKVLRADRSEHRAVRRFELEMEISAQLSHPNIVRTWASGQWQSVHWIAMELLDGLDLGVLLQRIGRPLPLDPALEVLRQTLLALEHAHAHDVIHRDIKPSNIFVGRGNHHVRVLDFGLALALNTTRLTRTGTMVGSPRYMAPERLRATEQVGPWTDLYSLGVVLYRMLTATMPFKATELAPLLVEVLEVDPPPPSAFNVMVPPEIDLVVAQLLAKRPTERYRSARAVLDDLQMLGVAARG